MAAFTSFDSPEPSRLAHQREEGAARRRIRLTCMSANRRRRRPRAPCAHLRQPGQQRPNLERRARVTPRPQESSTSLQKGLALAREESVAVVDPAGRAEARDLRAKRPSPPRCREANGGVAVVAADAAMNRMEGMMPKSNTRKLNDTQL